MRVELELELEGLGEVLDRADVGEGVGQTLLEEPLEGITLNGNQIGKLESLIEIAERITIAGDSTCRQRAPPFLAADPSQGRQEFEHEQGYGEQDTVCNTAVVQTPLPGRDEPTTEVVSVVGIGRASTASLG
jgi:hypothetical protein